MWWLVNSKSVLATKSQIPKDGKANAEFHNSSVKTLRVRFNSDVLCASQKHSRVNGSYSFVEVFLSCLMKQLLFTSSEIAHGDSWLACGSHAEHRWAFEPLGDFFGTWHHQDHRQPFSFLCFSWKYLVKPLKLNEYNCLSMFLRCSLNRDDYIIKYPPYIYVSRCHLQVIITSALTNLVEKKHLGPPEALLTQLT